MTNSHINNSENLYVSDKILLNNFQNQPLGEANVILSEFFNIEGCTLQTKKGDKDRKLITPNEKYFKTEKLLRDRALSNLYEFLRKNNRPIRDLYVCIPMCERIIVPRQDFTPLDMYYKEPIFPAFNDELGMLEIEFSYREEYDEVCLYCLGEKDPRPGDQAIYKLFFSTFCFCGLILQY